MNQFTSVESCGPSWLNTPSDSEMDDDMRKLVAAFGGDNWVRSLAAAPKSMRRFTDFLASFFSEDGTDLSLRDRELVAVAVSRENGCGYCVGHHTHNLAKAIGNQVEAYKFALEPKFANLSPRDMAMVEFARKVTRNPGSMSKADIDELRKHGISEQNITEILETAGYFNFANRMFMALGCPIDERIVQS